MFSVLSGKPEGPKISLTAIFSHLMNSLLFAGVISYNTYSGLIEIC